MVVGILGGLINYWREIMTTCVERSAMCMNVEFLAGTSIEDAAGEAIEKTRIFDVAYIQFNFNGVSMSVGQNATVKEAADEFKKALSSKHKFAVVNGRKQNGPT